jgi:DNA-binding transcriptional ArsR family regulator
MDLSDIKANAAKASDLLKSMSNQARLMILCNLVEGERSVSELEQLLDLSQSAISQHLAILRRERIVATRREGQNIYYSLVSDEAMAILSTLYGLYCGDKASMKKSA